jgi:CelD/BcsL family acetyltransferase involved in cellulose biosynthesis
MIGFEAGEWTKYSCSRILNLMMLKHFMDQGYAYLDHGIGDEDWKLTSCDQHVGLCQLAETRSWRGRLMVGGRRVRERLRSLRVWRALQPIKWALLRRRSRADA